MRGLNTVSSSAILIDEVPEGEDVDLVVEKSMREFWLK